MLDVGKWRLAEKDPVKLCKCKLPIALASGHVRKPALALAQIGLKQKISCFRSFSAKAGMDSERGLHLKVEAIYPMLRLFNGG